MKRYDDMQKYIIYGTGSVAERIYNELVDEGIQVEFFLDSMLSKEEFCGKKVYNLSHLDEINKNEYKYLLGSIASQISMKYELIKAGVKETNIEESRDYSEDAFEHKIQNIRKILLYPGANEDEKKVLMGDLKKYGCYNENVLIDIKPRNFIWEELCIDEYNLILVWDKTYLKDDNILNCDNVFCIDNTFYPTIRERILSRLGYKIHKENSSINFEDISKQNFSRLKERKKEAVYLLGNGPSMKRGMELYNENKNENTCCIVCNAFVKMEQKAEKELIPDVYLLVDIAFISEAYKEMISNILKYVSKNRSYLVVPYFWIPYLYKLEKDILNYVIGCRIDAKEIRFPNDNDISVCSKATNVITTLGIPFASVISDLVYIAGCDGFKMVEGMKEEWRYAEGINDNVTVRDGKSDMDWYAYKKKHYSYFDKILMYGEAKGKSYVSITNTYIDCLKQREGQVKK